MDTRSRLSRAIASPMLFARHANRLYHRRLGRRTHNARGTDPFEEDWDTLVLLDACRYDVFERRSELPGSLERRRSVASTTVEFLRATVDGRDLRDTVYVTANPQLYQHRDSIVAQFAAVIDVWRDEGWDEDARTVLPETMTERALEAAAAHPRKRLVVHYMQPHYPFVGADTTFDEGQLTDPASDGENVWGQVLTGSLDVDAETIWELYEANLDRALPHVETLLDELEGKTVVTADHGNMVGERASPIPVREWGHPRGIYTPQLVEVPWLEVERGERREIQSADAKQRGDANQGGDATDDDSGEEAPAVVTDRLRDLGYAE